ncbi:zinc finger protein RFP-like [Rhineura floridana]|uniref:zinc finger protein RFP-like n=1 Tax=Rhineura floridana TaxID=261503 RepID=UPI002AC859A8|nr:zinc finger protein RFP-like [Rhineura floridana]
MATGNPVKELCDETTCPLCREFFKDPAILDCGHNFCRACLDRRWGEAEPEAASCPQCRAAVPERSSRPNWQLANVAEIAKKLQEGKGGKRKRGVCERHQEPETLFCKEDEAPICPACKKLKQHRDHHVVPVEEAAQGYKEKVQAQLKSLEKERENVVDQKLIEELRSQACLTQLEVAGQKIRSSFEQMQNLLEEKKCFCLAQLGVLKKELERRQEENITRLSETVSHLSNMITAMDEKHKQPATEFLQDIESTLSKYEAAEGKQQLELSAELEERLRSWSQKSLVLKQAMEKLEESLEEALNEGSMKKAWNKVNVTLDPDTAHPRLTLSEDLRTVRPGSGMRDLPDSPERFDRMLCVLGCEKFASGRHLWEVEVEQEEGAMWAMGVATESVKRKGPFRPDPSEGIWALGRPFSDSSPLGHLVALTSPKPTFLSLGTEPKKIRVALDYEAGCVEFFDADTDILIFTFHLASFSGEKVQPYFQVWRGVTLNC